MERAGTPGGLASEAGLRAVEADRRDGRLRSPGDRPQEGVGVRGGRKGPKELPRSLCSPQDGSPGNRTWKRSTNPGTLSGRISKA